MLVAQAVPSSAGIIKGRYYKPLWSDYTDPPPFYPYSYETIFKGMSGFSVSATKSGSLPVGGAAGYETSTGEPVGYYELSVVPGNYGLLFHEHDELGMQILLNQVVPTASPQELRLYPYARYQNVVNGAAWDVFPAGTWSQSFVAKGNYVTQVGLHQTQEFGPTVQVYITADGPGPKTEAIGPVRSVPTDVVNPSSVFWSAGEVPTVPGRTYCANVFSPTGFQMYVSATRIQGGVAYPDGRVYKDYQAAPTMVTDWGTTQTSGLEMTIYEDTGGYVSVVNTTKYNKPRNTPMQLVSGCTTAGQTFTAMGSSLLSFSCRVQDTGHSAFLLVVTCYQGPGVNGEGVNQVGVAKYMKQVSNAEWNRCGVVWQPGEVPLTPGQTYYIKVKCQDGGAFSIWTTGENEYSGGSFFKNGNEQTVDMSTTITTEKFAGSMSQTPVKITNINVTRGVNSATVDWTTDVPTDTNYVDWSQETPYTKQAAGASGGTSHSVTLTNLLPNTQYHYRVVSKTAGKFDSYSRDFVFVTEPDQPNLLANPGFENGTLGPWNAFAIHSGGNVGLRTPTPQIPDFFGFLPHSGNWFYAGASNGASPNKAGVYQRVAVTPGDVLQLRGWVITYRTDPFPVSFDYECPARVGIDPNGGTDPRSDSIVWGPWVTAQDIVGAVEEGTGKGFWTEAYVTASAASDHVTVFFVGGAEKATRWDNWGFDDAMLTKMSAQSVERISDLAALADGTMVRLEGKLVVATSAEVGANYLMEPKVAGLRVESAAAFARGHRVTVQGRKGTKPTGEVYLYEAAPVTDVADAETGPLTTQAQVIGAKKLGPNNVGMLMQVTGKIYVDWSQDYYINDGSLPGNGLKIKTTHLSTLPNVDGFYDISGIVQLEGSAPNPTPVLCPRDDTDLIFWGWFD